MSRQTNRVISLQTRAPIACYGGSQPAEIPSAPAATRQNGADALLVTCVRDGNFCQCWMPAWFYLAERVSEERKADARPQ
jgi:hypothetical protein